MESFTRATPVGTITKIDSITIEPILEKHDIHFTINKDGTTKLITEKVNLENHIVKPTEIPQSDIVEVHKTVYEDGRIKLYDVNDNLLADEPTEAIKEVELADELDSMLINHDFSIINDYLLCSDDNTNLSELINIVNNPPTGVIISSVADNIISMTEQHTENGTLDGYEMVSLIDTSENKVLGTRVYDDNGEMQQCTMYSYDNCMINGYKEEYREILPSGAIAIFENHVFIENLTINFL